MLSADTDIIRQTWMEMIYRSANRPTWNKMDCEMEVRVFTVPLSDLTSCPRVKPSLYDFLKRWSRMWQHLDARLFTYTLFISIYLDLLSIIAGIYSCVHVNIHKKKKIWIRSDWLLKISCGQIYPWISNRIQNLIQFWPVRKCWFIFYNSQVIYTYILLYYPPPDESPSFYQAFVFFFFLLLLYFTPSVLPQFLTKSTGSEVEKHLAMPPPPCFDCSSGRCLLRLVLMASHQNK